MDNVTALDKLVRSLSFEVQAVPQDNIIQVTPTSKSAPLNVKIRVRKKEEAGLHYGVIKLPPNTSQPHSSPEVIRLISSDQTIMSFNMIMEADFGKPKKKTRKNVLGIFRPACLGGQSEENYHKAEINEETTTQSDGTLKKMPLNKNKDDRTRDFFGKCRPGGCLDPPFGEDREPYSPANEEEHAIDDKIVVNAPSQSVENKPRSSSIFSHKILNWKRKKSNIDALDKNNGVKRENTLAKTESVIDLYQSGSLRTSATYANSVMTYPHTVYSSELRIQENKLRDSDICIDPSKNSFYEHSGPFFVPGIVPGAPKKICTGEENDAEKNLGTDRKPTEDPQLNQVLGTIVTEKQPRPKVLATDIKVPSTNFHTDISRNTDSINTSKIVLENRSIIPEIIPLRKLVAIETPFTSTDKAKEETTDTEVLVTSSDITSDPGIEKSYYIAEKKVEDSKIEALLPLDEQQNTNDSTQAPYQCDTLQKNVTRPTKTKYFENDQDSTASVKRLNETDGHIILQNLDGPEKQSTKISTHEDLNKQIILTPINISEFGIDNNTDNKKVIEPETNKELGELLALDNDTSKNDVSSMPDTLTNVFGFKLFSEDAEKSSEVNEDKKPDEKNIDILGSGSELTAFDLTDTDKYNKITENDDRGIPTPIIRDTPLELEVDDFQQIWKNDEDSLESVPLHINKNMHEENIGLLDKVNETADEISNIFDPKYNINDANARNDIILDNYDKNISYSRIENKENIDQYGSNRTEDDSYPEKEMDILDIMQSKGGNIDSTSKSVNNLLGDPLEMINVQQYDAMTTVGEDAIEVPVHEKDSDKLVQKYDDNLECTSNVQQIFGDGTPADQVTGPIKTEEIRIKFIDVIDFEKNNEDTEVSATDSDYLENPKDFLFENGFDVDLQSKESYLESDCNLSPQGQDQKIDNKTTESGKLDVVIAGLETKYPYRSNSEAQSPENDLSKSFKINLGIQSYKDNDKLIIKSFDSNTEPQRYPNDILKVVNCDLEIGNEVLIPIGLENDLVVEIKSKKSKTRTIEVFGRLDTGTKETDAVETEFQIKPINRNLVIADDIRKTLLAVYEEELLPLRKSISELKSNMEVLASQQVVVKARGMFEKRPRAKKTVPTLFKKCGCIRR